MDLRAQKSRRFWTKMDSATLPGASLWTVRALPASMTESDEPEEDRVRTRILARLALVLVMMATRSLAAQTVAPERRGPSAIPPPRPFRVGPTPSRAA